MHLRILPDHQKLFFKRDIFERLEWLKTCFYAFAHTFRSPETFFQKRCFLLSGVVKNVFLEWFKMFFYAFTHTSRPPETFFRKDIFDRQEWLKTCFDAFSHTSRTPETFCQKRYF
jgi:hypothetical protein